MVKVVVAEDYNPETTMAHLHEGDTDDTPNPTANRGKNKLRTGSLANLFVLEELVEVELDDELLAKKEKEEKAAHKGGGSTTSISGSSDGLEPFEEHGARHVIQVQPKHVTEKNRKIVESNLRHLHFLMALFLAANLIVTGTFVTLLIIVLDVRGENLFISSSPSMTMFLPSALSISILAGLLSLIMTGFKIQMRTGKIVSTLYAMSCAFALIQFAVLILATSGMLISAGPDLHMDMKQDLKASWKNNRMSDRFLFTQKTRDCCGVDSHTDWPLFIDNDDDDKKGRGSVGNVIESQKGMDRIIEDDDDADNVKGRQFTLRDLPDTCRRGVIAPKDRDQNPFHGCYNLEKGWLLWYLLWYFGLLWGGLVLNALMHLQLRRLLRFYASPVFKPYLAAIAAGETFKRSKKMKGKKDTDSAPPKPHSAGTDSGGI